MQNTLPKIPSVRLLIAEDSEFDQMVLRRAFTAVGFQDEIRFVSDGETLLEALLERVSDPANAGAPCVVLLDMHLPRLDGREALKQIRQDERLRHLPVVVLTTSDSSEHVRELYGLGANSYVVKPHNFDALVAAMRQIKSYWFDTVRLPAAA